MNMIKTKRKPQRPVRSTRLLALADRLDDYAAEWRSTADKNVEAGNRDSFQWCDGRSVSYKLAAEEVRKTASANHSLTRRFALIIRYYRSFRAVSP
jgi:hypothetical protein